MGTQHLRLRRCIKIGRAAFRISGDKLTLTLSRANKKRTQVLDDFNDQSTDATDRATNLSREVSKFYYSFLDMEGRSPQPMVEGSTIAEHTRPAMTYMNRSYIRPTNIHRVGLESITPRSSGS